MAVDTLAKRWSMLNFGRGIILPKPNGTLSSGDRAHLVGLYSGIALDSPAGPDPFATSDLSEITDDEFKADDR